MKCPGLAILLFASLVFPAAAHGLGQVDCVYGPYTVSGPNSFLSYCIGADGNFYNLESPSGVEMILQQGSRDGYAICDATNNTGYYDYGTAGQNPPGVESIGVDFANYHFCQDRQEHI